MKPLTLDQLKQIANTCGKLHGWDFSSVHIERSPVPWDYVDVVRKYLRPTDRVLDIGTGGGEIFLSLAPFFREGVGIDQSSSMIEAALHNQHSLSIGNASLIKMDGRDLHFASDDFDVILLRHAHVYTGEIVRVLRPGGYFITQTVGQRSSLNLLNTFDWTPANFGPDWWQPVATLADEFRSYGCHIIAEAEYDIPYWFLDVGSFLFWLLAVPWPETIELDKHWQYINKILETCQTERGIQTNEHRGLLIVQKTEI